MGDDSNLSDGGFTLSKLVSEFGLIGMVLAAAQLIAAVRCGRLLRRWPGGALPVDQVLACVVPPGSRLTS